MEEEAFPLKPLSVDQARLIEARSRGMEKKVAQQLKDGRPRSRSLGTLEAHAIPISFETYQTRVALHQRPDEEDKTQAKTKPVDPVGVINLRASIRK